MMKRRLISSAEAIPAKSQHTKPCDDCPWARTALKGWLGSNTAEEWIGAAHGEARVECHSLTGVQCAGIAIYRANNGKLPRDLSILRLPPDESKVFATPTEFLEHHKIMSNTEAQFIAIQDLMTEVESDTSNVSREQYREFLEEVAGECELRLQAIACDDALDAKNAGMKRVPNHGPSSQASAKASAGGSSEKRRKR